VFVADSRVSRVSMAAEVAAGTRGLEGFRSDLARLARQAADVEALPPSGHLGAVQVLLAPLAAALRPSPQRCSRVSSPCAALGGAGWFPLRSQPGRRPARPQRLSGQDVSRHPSIQLCTLLLCAPPWMIILGARQAGC
jgi:hypothetical protein